ncbi:MRL1 [Symbiodinium sp. CCMP2456]|nr:MRL1 [Symbiodinium sp. CCMP2456]
MAAAIPAWADPAAFTNVLAASCRARRWQHAFAALEAAQKQDKANVIHFNVILRSCQQAEAWETSLGVLGSFPGLRMHPDAVSWTAVITGLKPFWQLSSHLLHAASRRGATDSITFGAASLAFESDGLWTRSLALQTYNQQGGGLCDAVLVGSAASACDKGCAWADSLGLLTWASASRIRLSDICFSAATSSCSRSWQWEVALGLLQSSARMGFQTSLIILNSAESAVAKAGSWWGALSILRIFQAGRVEPDAVSHNACLTSLKPRGRWEEAAALLSAMQQRAVPVGDVSINAALAVLWEAGRWRGSLALLQHRQVADTPVGSMRLPTLRSMDGIRLRETLSLCEQAALWDLALDLLQWQATALLQPSTAGICSAARACERARQWQQSLVVAGRHSPATGSIASMSAEELLQRVWMGAQQLRWDENWEAVAQALASKLGQLSLEDLATALWSFGTLVKAPASFLEAAAKEAVQRLELGEAATPRTLADLAWGFATLGFQSSRLFDALQLRILRWEDECHICCRSNSERAQFVSKAQVVVWAASHVGALHETVLLYLQDLFRRLADLLEAERGSFAHPDTTLPAAGGFRGLPVPHVLQNFHDRRLQLRSPSKGSRLKDLLGLGLTAYPLTVRNAHEAETKTCVHGSVASWWAAGGLGSGTQCHKDETFRGSTGGRAGHLDSESAWPRDHARGGGKLRMSIYVHFIRAQALAQAHKMQASREERERAEMQRILEKRPVNRNPSFNRPVRPMPMRRGCAGLLSIEGPFLETLRPVPALHTKQRPLPKRGDYAFIEAVCRFGAFDTVPTDSAAFGDSALLCLVSAEHGLQQAKVARESQEEANSQARTNRLAATWPEQATPTRSKSSAPSREQKVDSREQLPPRAASERARTGDHEGVVTAEEPPPTPVAEMTAKGREWLVFRLREVYTAPRLPHVMASEWKPIAHSAEQMKFGVCKFSKIAGVEAKDRERWKKVQTGELKVLAPARPRRPRVPPGPRRLVARPPEVDVQTEPEQQISAPSPKRSPSGHERWKARREPQECPWCGCMEPPTHPKQCKLRMVECKYCKQSMELGSLRLHFKHPG